MNASGDAQNSTIPAPPMVATKTPGTTTSAGLLAFTSDETKYAVVPAVANAPTAAAPVPTATDGNTASATFFLWRSTLASHSAMSFASLLPGSATDRSARGSSTRV